ncbi:hypothetical protein J3R30DRAFT_2705178 [Lentinula aciculospora]|uniref:Uncharacterized protein n=1 Tax=Lentinula aciculospora TaxID=153920 RepID=A0A9W9ABR5_9AGAR|nr:hypothetical protein J3R30DRAFT_2705178 [Lentinula aciculospora]
MMPYKSNLTAELEPHLDAALPADPPRPSKYTNPFGVIARPSGVVPDPLVNLNPDSQSPIMTREKVDDFAFSSDIGGPESLPSDGIEDDNDEDFYKSIPHYITNIWHYIMPDDQPEADVPAPNVEPAMTVARPSYTTESQSVIASPLASFTPFPWYTETPSPPNGNSLLPASLMKIDAYAFDPFLPPYYDFNRHIMATACQCERCNPPQDYQDFPLYVWGTVSDFLLSPLDTPATTPLPTPSSDTTSFPDFFWFGALG